MIRKLKSGEYRLYSGKKDAKSGRRRNLGTFTSLEAAKNTNGTFSILSTALERCARCRRAT